MAIFGNNLLMAYIFLALKNCGHFSFPAAGEMGNIFMHLLSSPKLTFPKKIRFSFPRSVKALRREREKWSNSSCDKKKTGVRWGENSGNLFRLFPQKRYIFREKKKKYSKERKNLCSIIMGNRDLAESKGDILWLFPHYLSSFFFCARGRESLLFLFFLLLFSCKSFSGDVTKAVNAWNSGWTTPGGSHK